MQGSSFSSATEFILIGFSNFLQHHPAHLLPAVPADVSVHTAGEPADHGHHLEKAQPPHPHVPLSVCPLHFRGPLHLCHHRTHVGRPALHLTVVVVHYDFASVIYIKPKGPQSLEGDTLMGITYMVFTLFLNPIIFSLRNKELKIAVKTSLANSTQKK
ncbi:olfactory receptor 2T3-like [Moschus berezovskii]|uniref:olfactory receptor 2T3-like n=1 Tax=Moschus berezovskii TaxID=68408 RepID=UPI0024438270|nr:olfactory receptor 2T3-like [Moschus berezovskii]